MNSPIWPNPLLVLELGLPEFDDQHRRQLQKVADLHGAIVTSATPAGIEMAFEELYAFMLEHFAHEERLMSDIEFPESARHAAEHTLFLGELEKLRSHAQTGAVTAELPQMIRKWVIEHLILFDRKYADYLLQSEDEAGG
jgi:hemerythrin